MHVKSWTVAISGTTDFETTAKTVSGNTERKEFREYERMNYDVFMQ
jgi:hypothetical protein